LKKFQLELGGKSPCIVFADADLEKAAELLANSFTFLSGQACIASTRVLVEESVMEEFMGFVNLCFYPHLPALCCGEIQGNYYRPVAN
jgi:acyl-CoA reductase-like NAD-dependent aldehyde dehydrogenase